MQKIALLRSNHDHRSCLNDRLLDNRLLDKWLRFYYNNLSLLRWLLHNNLRLNDWLHINFAEMEENDFPELNSVHLMIIVEFKLHTFCGAMDFWECQHVPLLQSKC
jgi:hypothetical protein